MFCTKCGKQVPDNSKFCTGCGAPIGNSGPVKMKPAAEPKKQPVPKEKKPAKAPKEKSGAGRVIGIIVLIVLIAVIAGGLIFYLVAGRKTKIDANQYLEVSLTGENGSGYASAQINYEKMISDHAKAFELSDKNKEKVIKSLMGLDEVKDSGILGNIAGNILGGSAADIASDYYSDEELALMILYGYGDGVLQGAFDKDSDLSNGDTITYKWTVDNETLAKYYKVKIETADQKFEVDGLAGDGGNASSGSSSGLGNLFGNSDDKEEDADTEEASKAEEDEKEKDSSKKKSGGNTDTMVIPGKESGSSSSTPAQTEAAAPATASVQNASNVSLGGYKKVSISSWSESSRVVQDGIDNSAYAAIDGNSITSWQEGVDGQGAGEYVLYQFSKEEKVHAISFKLGNWRDAQRYDLNSRPKQLILSLGGQEFTVLFPDGMTEYVVTFSSDVPSSSLKVTLDSVYAGSGWDDTCISEITVYAGN